MKYINAETILPKDLIQRIQTFVAGGYVYIPAPEQKKAWGTYTGIRRELQERNEEIRSQYERGQQIRELSQQYCLCESSIYKIIRGKSD